MSAGCCEGGQQAAEGVRGPDTEHQVERVRGGEACRVLAVQDQTILDAEVDGGLMGACQRMPGKIDALGVQARVHCQGAQQPFSTATAEVQSPAPWEIPDSSNRRTAASPSGAAIG